MRQKLIAGNWKMNGLTEPGLSLAEELAQRMHRALELNDPEPPNCELLICPPFTLLAPVWSALAGSGISLGGQDCHTEISGAHTGDISAMMLKDAGCTHVILGHSERRQDHGETDAGVKAKAQAAVEAGLVPIVCVGESEGERDSGSALSVIAGQVAGSLPSLVTGEEAVLAYEPIWAIGTGKTATPEDVAEVHGAIRALIAERDGEAAASNLRILYGGSVKPENAEALMATADVDGALVGGASLKADDFWAIAASCP